MAALPLAAAIGGVVVPALFYLAFNDSPATRAGCAVGSATDIALAIGVLALLGKSVPSATRIFLLAIAVIDDLLAVLIIAFFYSGGLDYSGFMLVAVAVALILLMQRAGISNAWAYVAPGALLWAGVLWTGAHPTLAGVALGLLTPMHPQASRERHAITAIRALGDVEKRVHETGDPHALAAPLRTLRRAQRELVPPALRVQLALHPWVAFVIVPVFALANAGVSIDNAGLAGGEARSVLVGILVALVVGKPLGIVLGSWLAVRSRCCELPPGLTWRGVVLVGMLGGIGFTMAIFIGTLAFPAQGLLTAAKRAVLLASTLAAALGLALGWSLSRRDLRPKRI